MKKPIALYYSYLLYYNDFVNERGDSSYYMPYSVDSKNHAISIVGWDDDFPAEAFAKDFVRENHDGEVEDEPLPNGAWLIKNSWGKRAYKTPDEASGYYWISYYDKSLAVPMRTEKDYIISKGRFFQNKKTSGTWERYLLPIKIEDEITPSFVSSIIIWAVNGNEAVSVNWDGKTYPV